MTNERSDPWIHVPGPELDNLRLWRPTPLIRARRLEAALGTPARIYYKDESCAMHQGVVGTEAADQLARCGEVRPEVVIGFCGGGSDLAGIVLPFVADREIRLVAVEPSTRATLTSGCFENAVSPLVSHLVRSGRMEAVAYPEDAVFDAAIQFARTQGPFAAPETAHAIRAAIDEALLAREDGTPRVILFSYASHGLVDHDDHLAGVAGL